MCSIMAATVPKQQEDTTIVEGDNGEDADIAMETAYNRRYRRRLVALYRDRRCLWDPTDGGYRDKFKKDAAWNEIAVTMSDPVDTLKRLVNELRGQFAREVRKSNIRLSGQGPEDGYKSRWFLYNDLMFLAGRPPTRRSAKNAANASDTMLLEGDDDDRLKPQVEYASDAELDSPASATSAKRRKLNKRIIAGDIRPQTSAEALSARADRAAVARGDESIDDVYTRFGHFVADTLRENPTRAAEWRRSIVAVLYDLPIPNQGTITTYYSNQAGDADIYVVQQNGET